MSCSYLCTQGMTPKHVHQQVDEGTSQLAEQLSYDPHHFLVLVAYEWFTYVIPRKKLVRERGIRLEPRFDDRMIAEVQRH